MTEPSEPSHWRSLGSYEVLAADFLSAGEAWDAVLPSDFSEPVPDWLRAELPEAGWREVTLRDTGPPKPRRLFAAPAETGWMTAQVWPQPEGPPVFTGDLSAYQLRPLQEVRRQGLAVSWNEPLRVAVSELDAVSVTLSNTSDATWTPDSEESAFVHGHFLDDAGQTPADCAFSYAPQAHAFKNVSLQPGESLELPVTFGHGRVSLPGSYVVEAILVSLNLRSPRGMLEVVADSDEAPRKRLSEAQLAERLVQEEYERAVRKLTDRDPAGS